MVKLDMLLKKSKSLPKLTECYDYGRLTDTELTELLRYYELILKGKELSESQKKREQEILNPIKTTMTKIPCEKYDSMTREELDGLIDLYERINADG